MPTDDNGDWFDSNPAPQSDPFADQINALYQQYAGRPASAGEIAAHRGNPGGVAAVEQMLKPAAAAAPAAAPPTVYAPVQGFDTAKLNDPTYSSAKYTPAAKSFSAGQGAGVAVSRGNLQPMVDYAKAHGFPNASVSGDDKIDYGDGNGPIDAVQQNGSVWFQNGADRLPGYVAPGAGSGGGTGFTGAMNNAMSASNGGFGNYGTYQSAPWTGGDYTPPPLPSWLQGQYVAPTWQGGDFKEPTMAEVEATPGYQTRMNAGQQVIERSAAAKGSVLNGGTQQALARYGQDYGQNEYQTARGNAFQDYQSKYGQFQDFANRDLGARNQQLGEYNNAVGIGQNTYQNRYAAYLGENNRTLSDYMTNYNVSHTAETDYWKRLNDLYSTGANLAGSSYKPPQ